MSRAPRSHQKRDSDPFVHYTPNSQDALASAQTTDPSTQFLKGKDLDNFKSYQQLDMPSPACLKKDFADFASKKSDAQAKGEPKKPVDSGQSAKNQGKAADGTTSSSKDNPKT